MGPAFTWVPFYKELAQKLLPFRQRQSELVSLLQKLRLQGLTITPLEDRDAGGQRFQLQEIDPFTFFGVFNRGIADEMRRRILQALKGELGIAADVPSDFSGIPVLDNRRSWFFAFKADRGPGDVDALWEVFTYALGPDPLARQEFRAAFDKAVEIQGIKVNLTMGLFWVRPDTFFALDSVMREYLGIALPKPQLSAASYSELIRSARSTHPETFPELSYSAWVKKHQATPPTPPEGAHPKKPIPSDVTYWMVGAYWHGSDPADQTERFLRDGIWENGYEDKYLDLVGQMKAGDRIAIKAAVTQKEGLPFDAGGRTVSKMLIKATGTIVEL
jgi:5-methylcytosine-specific restriction protein B